MKSRTIIAALTGAAMLLAGASTAFAQSSVSGTLSSGASNPNSSGNSLSGSVAPSGNSLSGTVGSSGSTGSTGSAGGGGGGGSGSNTVDICPNLGGAQSTLPSGYVIQNGNCIVSSTGGAGGATGSVGGTSAGNPGSVLGASTGPNVPNTGAGGDVAAALLMLGISALAAIGGTRLFLKLRAA